MADSVATLITKLGGPAFVAGELDLATSTVASWKDRGSIPADRWVDIVKLSVRVSKSVTYERLARIHQRPRRDADAAGAPQ